MGGGQRLPYRASRAGAVYYNLPLKHTDDPALRSRKAGMISLPAPLANDSCPAPSIPCALCAGNSIPPNLAVGSTRLPSVSQLRWSFDEFSPDGEVAIWKVRGRRHGQPRHLATNHG